MSNVATQNMRWAQQERRKREAARPWPKCRCCGADLLLPNVRLGFCNVECRDRYNWERSL